MGLPEELYFAMFEVGHCAHCHKIPGPLAHTMIDIVQKSLELWRRDERAAMHFAAMVLAGPTNWAAARACGWGLLEIARAGGILGDSQWWILVWHQSCLRPIIAPGATGRGSQPSNTSPQLPRFLKMWPRTGWRNKPSGRSTFRPHGMFHAPSLTNEVHQADLFFLSHDRLPRGQKTYKYALNVVDVASRYKEAEPLTSKSAAEVADALSRIYRRGPLKWPKLLQVDAGREFMGTVNQLLAKHRVKVRPGRVDVQRDQGIVERWNRTLAERLFGHQQAQELLMNPDEQSREWVKRLPVVTAALNGEVTQLTGKKPVDAIRQEHVPQNPSSVVPGRLVGLEEEKLPSSMYQPGELEGGRWQATDPIWSLQVYRLGRSVTKPDKPVLYYLLDGPARGFVREELLPVPRDTQLPPGGVLKHWAVHRCMHSFQLHCWQGIFVSIGKGIHSVFSYPSLGVEGDNEILFRCCP